MPDMFLLKPMHKNHDCVGDVIRDIKSTNGKLIVFNDVSFADDVEYVKELLTAMIPMKKRWGGVVT
jgi:hypothetical protein